MNSTRAGGGEAGRPRRLGRGLNSLLAAPVAVEVGGGERGGAAARAVEVEVPVHVSQEVAAGPRQAVVMIPVGEVVANRFQPRRSFDNAALEELAASIRAAGVVQPILVRMMTHGTSGSTVETTTERSAAYKGTASTSSKARYELVAGERRWRAAQLAGLAKIPAVVAELTDEQAAEWALIENVQRVDLGAMEQAYAIKQLVDQFGLTHQAAAEKLGMDRATVTNLLRLTTLEPEVLALLERGTARAATSKPGTEREDGSSQHEGERGGLTAGHGKVLLSYNSGPRRVAMALRAAEAGWSVRKLASVIGLVDEGPATKILPPLDPESVMLSARERSLSSGMRELEKQLGEHLGTKVELRVRAGGKKGSLVVKFFDLDQFDGLMAKMGFVLK